MLQLLYFVGTFSRLMYHTHYICNILQCIFISAVGLALIITAQTALDSVINSAAAIFFAEVDDLILAMLIKGKSRKLNENAEVCEIIKI